MNNPYEHITYESFDIIESGIISGFHVYMVDTTHHSAFDVCVFRDHLGRFILDNFSGSYHMGFDDRFINNPNQHLVIGVENQLDTILLKENFIVY